MTEIATPPAHRVGAAISGARAALGSVAALLARRHRTSRPEAHRQARLAKGLDEHPITAAAMSVASVNDEQALAIIAGVDALPDDLDADLKVKAEEHLIELAADYDAKALKGFARTILEVVAPAIADAHLAKQLEKLERDAEEANRFRIWETRRDGSAATSTSTAFPVPV